MYLSEPSAMKMIIFKTSTRRKLLKTPKKLAAFTTFFRLLRLFPSVPFTLTFRHGTKQKSITFQHGTKQKSTFLIGPIKKTILQTAVRIAINTDYCSSVCIYIALILF